MKKDKLETRSIETIADAKAVVDALKKKIPIEARKETYLLMPKKLYKMLKKLSQSKL